MSTTLSFTNTTFDILIGVIVGAIWGILAGLEALLRLAWRHRRGISACLAISAGVAICVAYPLLPLGLGITALFGWVTYPRAVRA